ncbi:hypothetical protein ACIQU4_38975 [Streptomyces sp. NPDC090741]|uniref:hypothetical protein n=1 Tax=Streptomyces sp. NPDC090741 TaxID=3365967 RepID=UPI00380360F9
MLPKRLAGLVAGALLLTAAGTIPAHAEAERDSYINGWTLNKESNRWYDSNSDGAWTGVYFEGCSTDANFSSAGLHLYKDLSWSPDVNKGSRTNYCGWVDWNDPDDAGQYYFALKSLADGEALWVNKVRIGW